MTKNKIWNKKKAWVLIGIAIGFFGGFVTFATMVIQHGHQVRGIM